MNKQKYWENRKQGKRGQGEIKYTVDMNTEDYKNHNGEPKHPVQIFDSVKFVNRAEFRKLVRPWKNRQEIKNGSV
jgi:hypothetical protein